MLKTISRTWILLLLLSGCGVQSTNISPTVYPSSTLSTNVRWWRPTPGLTWQLQFSALPVEMGVEADVYDIDLFENDASVVEALHKQGRKVICYLSVGSREDWRPDAGQFPGEVIGKSYIGWPGERWLDIRRIDLLAPIMRARLDQCKAKGFDGVEPDNIEVFTQDSGFSITYADQLAYAQWLAAEAHARGLAIGLKNAPGMVADSLMFFDFAIIESAFFYEWIEETLPFIEAGKPVFAVEYTDTGVDFQAACDWSRENQISMIQKDRMLTSALIVCP